MTTESRTAAAVRPLGESAILIQLPDRAPYATTLAVAQRLSSLELTGVRDVTSAYGTIALYFDPLATSSEQLATRVLEQVETAGVVAQQQQPLVTIPVTYDGTDLELVAERTGLTRTEVVALHSAVEYEAHAVGFVPGFAYLGEVDPRLHLARRDTPRTRVPAGAVAIAGAYTAVYPFETPGGWHLLGRTETVMFDVDRSPPALLVVGTRVRFIAA